jgi:hypothetical protein
MAVCETRLIQNDGPVIYVVTKRQAEESSRLSRQDSPDRTGRAALWHHGDNDATEGANVPLNMGRIAEQ